MTRVEYAADRLRHHVAAEHHATFTGLPWAMLQPAEQRMWVQRARVVMDADSAWRPPDGHGPGLRAAA